MSTGPPVRRLSDWPTDRLVSVATEYGTPAYVIDLSRIRENLYRFQAAFPAADIHYAVKANAGRAVLETFAREGIGAECASAGEIERALDAGFDPEEVLYTPVNAPSRDLDTVLHSPGPAPTITVGALDTIRRLADREFGGEVAIRVHPGTGAGHSDAVATGADASFGIPVDRVPRAVELAVESGMSVVGLHAHAGSGISNDDMDAHRIVVETLARVANRIDQDLDFVDVGGGFGVPYRPETEPLDIQAIGESTRTALDSVDATLRVEPGRYLVADAGVLLTSVNTVKPTADRTFAGVDAGMTDLLRPALYDAYHPVSQLDASGEREEEPVTVVGPVCESTDVLARDRTLASPERGDLLAIGITGAYGIEMASQYTSRPRSPVVAIDDSTTRRIRRREQISDITATERDR